MAPQREAACPVGSRRGLGLCRGSYEVSSQDTDIVPVMPAGVGAPLLQMELGVPRTPPQLSILRGP